MTNDTIVTVNVTAEDIRKALINMDNGARASSWCAVAVALRRQFTADLVECGVRTMIIDHTEWRGDDACRSFIGIFDSEFKRAPERIKPISFTLTRIGEK